MNASTLNDMKAMARFSAVVVFLATFTISARAVQLDESLLAGRYISRQAAVIEPSGRLLRAVHDGNTIVPVVDLPEVAITADNPVPGQVAVRRIGDERLPVVDLPMVSVEAPYNTATLHPAVQRGDDFVVSVSLPVVEVAGQRDTVAVASYAGTGDTPVNPWDGLAGSLPLIGVYFLFAFFLR